MLSMPLGTALVFLIHIQVRLRPWTKWYRLVHIYVVYALLHRGRNATLHNSYPRTFCVTSTPIYMTIYRVLVDNGWGSFVFLNLCFINHVQSLMGAIRVPVRLLTDIACFLQWEFSNLILKTQEFQTDSEFLGFTWGISCQLQKSSKLVLWDQQQNTRLSLWEIPLKEDRAYK